MGGILTVKLYISKIVKWSEYIVGIYFLSMGGSVVLIDIFRDISMGEKIVEIIMGVIFIVLGIIFWKLACKRRKLICSAKRYGRYLREGDFYQFSELASVMGTDNDTLTSDIETLLEKGYLKDIVIDYQEQTINKYKAEKSSFKASNVNVSEKNNDEKVNGVRSKVIEKIERINQHGGVSESEKTGQEKYKELKFKKVYRNFIFMGISILPTVLGFIGIWPPALEMLMILGIFATLIFAYIGIKNLERMELSCGECGAWMSLDLEEAELLKQYKEHRHDIKVKRSETKFRDRYGHQFSKNIVGETTEYIHDDYDVIVGEFKCLYRCKECGSIIERIEKHEMRID